MRSHGWVHACHIVCCSPPDACIAHAEHQRLLQLQGRASCPLLGTVIANSTLGDLLCASWAWIHHQAAVARHPDRLLPVASWTVNIAAVLALLCGLGSAMDWLRHGSNHDTVLRSGDAKPGASAAKGGASTANTDSQRLSYLDGLRGVLSLVVVANHFVRMAYPALLSQLWDTEAHSTWEQAVAWYTPLGAFYGGEFAVVRSPMPRRWCVSPQGDW